MLFGHQNDDNNQPAAAAPAPQNTPIAPPPAPMPTPGVNPLAVDHDTGVSLPSAPAHSLDQADEPEPSVLDQPSSDSSPATPFSPDPKPAASLDAPEPSESPVTTDHAAPANDDLLHLKQQALTQLSPLVSQLDQNPEEKFRTTMMLIQSTDNQALLQDAYETAQKISDEKVRAQALLDVVNEINYFQQKPAA
jgi:hypothetical protein